MSTNADIREQRVALVREGHRLGFSYMPLRGKVAIQRGWQELRAASLEESEGFARRGNVGVRTGSASGGLVVVDLDPGASLSVDDFPATVTVLTGRAGGMHLYFRTTERLGNGTGSLPEHIDIRGNGGYVVAAGSVHPETGVVYRYAEGRAPRDLPIAELPARVVELIKQRPTARSGSPRPGTPPAPSGVTVVSAPRAYMRGALESECTKVRQALKGRRNKTLNQAALNMGKLVGPDMLDRATVENELLAATDLPHVAAIKTIRSGMKAGALEPRTLVRRERPKSHRSPPVAPVPDQTTPRVAALFKSPLQRAYDLIEAAGFRGAKRGVLRAIAGHTSWNGWVARGEGIRATVETLAAEAEISVPWTSHQLSRLAEVGVIRFLERSRGGRDPDGRGKTHQLLLSIEELERLAATTGAPVQRPRARVARQPSSPIASSTPKSANPPPPPLHSEEMMMMMMMMKCKPSGAAVDSVTVHAATNGSTSPGANDQPVTAARCTAYSRSIALLRSIEMSALMACKYARTLPCGIVRHAVEDALRRPGIWNPAGFVCTCLNNGSAATEFNWHVPARMQKLATFFAALSALTGPARAEADGLRRQVEAVWTNHEEILLAGVLSDAELDRAGQEPLETLRRLAGVAEYDTADHVYLSGATLPSATDAPARTQPPAGGAP